MGHWVVEMGREEVEGGGEGLYAKRNIPAGTLIAYYNGIRMTKEQRTPYGDTGYAIFVEWAERGRRTGDHMDLPPEVRKILSTGFRLISESPGPINLKFRVWTTRGLKIFAFPYLPI